jgi:hypothetical protein
MKIYTMKITDLAFFPAIIVNYRKRLYDCFLNSFDLSKETICLDVGGVSTGFEALPQHCKCVSINLFCNKKERGWSKIIADGRFLPFKTQSIDYVLSNSVIEHITDKTGKYSIEGAGQYSIEIRRVAKEGYFISCPYFYTIIEPHFVVPFFQFVPEKTRRFLIFKMRLTLGHLNPNRYLEIRLLSPKELAVLFPKASLSIFNLFCFPWASIVTLKKEKS